MHLKPEAAQQSIDAGLGPAFDDQGRPVACLHVDALAGAEFHAPADVGAPHGDATVEHEDGGFAA